MSTELIQPVKKTKRRWLQFSLRTMFVLLTILCIWLAILANRARVQREAVEAIRAAGATVYYDFQLEPSEGSFPPYLAANSSIHLDASPAGPAWLCDLIGVDYFARPLTVRTAEGKSSDELAAQIARLPDLDAVSLNAPSELTDAGLEYLSRLHRLRFLYIANEQLITTAGLQNITRLKQLREITLRQVSIGAGGLEFLRELPNLRRLDLIDCEDLASAELTNVDRLKNLEWFFMEGKPVITDADLQHLSNLTNLRFLTLRNSQITDRGLARLVRLHSLCSLVFWGPNEISDAGLEKVGEFTELERLNLSSTQFSDAGLAHLTNLSNLKWLVLTGCRDVTDEGLLKLQGLTKLQDISAGDTQVTAAGIAKLQQSLPSVSVHLSPPVPTPDK